MVETSFRVCALNYYALSAAYRHLEGRGLSTVVSLEGEPGNSYELALSGLKGLGRGRTLWPGRWSTRYSEHSAQHSAGALQTLLEWKSDRQSSISDPRDGTLKKFPFVILK